MSKFTEIEADKIELAAKMMKAIAHPVRLAILGHLSDGKDLSVSEIHVLVNIEQSTASHHLGILKDKGIVISRRDGKNTFYKMKNKNLNSLIDCISVCACAE